MMIGKWRNGIGTGQMPVSRKRRWKKSNPQSAKDTSTVVTLPDRRAMEGFMSAIGGRRANDETGRAQEVMYEAWDQTNPRARVALAHKALTISPLCADAYVLLAEEEAKSVEEALEYYRKGVEAGVQVLGPKGFKEYAAHFWGVLETRPYMRARAGLAATLNALGEVDAAISNYRDMLRLNPNDNQGIRYELASCLMKSGDTEALKKLLKQYDEDGSALWLYTQALVAFRENKADNKTEELVKKACEQSCFRRFGRHEESEVIDQWLYHHGRRGRSGSLCPRMGLRLAYYARCGRLAYESCG